MIISGLEKFSLLDYPGKISAVLFTFGCNLNCPFCHNPELKLGNWNDMSVYTTDEIYQFMKEKIGKLDALTITGGEPTIHDDLLDFIKKIKSLGFLIKLDTNGVNCEKVERIMKEKVVDYWAMDIKGDIDIYRKCGFKLDNLVNIKQSIKLIKNCGLDYEFRTTVLKFWHTESVFQEIGKMLKGVNKYYIQNFRSGKTLDTSLTSFDSFTHEELLNMKKVMEKYITKVEIRD
jgi:pyruvate formate lyase activating enzyme